MDTTTPDGGAQAQPQEPAAVTTGHNPDQVITTDAAGTPTMVPVSEAEASTSPSESATAPASDAVSEEKETQAPAEQPAADRTDDQIAEWSEKKGIKVDPNNPTEVKLARMSLEAERKMHEANQSKLPAPPPPEELASTGDPNYDQIVNRLNRSEQMQYVTGWFNANPEAAAHRDELQQIATERPWLNNLDDVYAHFLANPKRETDLKQAGAKEALTELAQKQQQIPPGSNATNSGVYESQAITPGNVWTQIDSHDQEWFEKNHEAINKAIAGK